MTAKFEQLRARLGEISDIGSAAAVLSWDQQTYMPAGGAEARAMQLSTLSKTAHNWFVSDEIGELLEDLEAELAGADYDSFEASLVRVTRREYDRERKLPAELVAELRKTTALAHQAWEKAREAADYAQFQPYLEKILDLTLQRAEAWGYEERVYDALLEGFEPGMKTAEVEVLFGEMKEGLVPLVQAIAERQDAVDDSLFDQEFSVDKQWDFGVEVVRALGYDFEHGRQDTTAHPFTTSFSPTDVRLTTRLFPDMFKSALFASIHEAGHGMYEQGVDLSLDRTPLGHGTSSAVHESQSRLWENMVGRSRGFWIHWLPRLKEYFPRQLEGIGVEAFYQAINRVQPSLIRVEADEVTYNLHIFVRFDIENMLVEGKVKVAELPELWDAKMEEYLGIRPPDVADGVLQDVHWSSGYFGYFPTYSLGNLLAAQLYSQALADEPGISDQIEKGEFSLLFNWMRGHIHKPGSKYMPAELVERVTGGPIRTGPFLDYVRTKFGELYGL
ncbi:MAG: carboxypeptidase M32 [Anaerolineae bacterium]